jgi:hypothetical protein
MRPRPYSLYLGAAALALFAVQSVPILAMAGLFPLHLILVQLVSPVAQLALLVMFVEAVMGRIPRLLAIVPLLIYGGYYATLLYERLLVVPRIEAELKASNSQTIAFDADAEILHNTSGLNTEDLVVAFKLPIAFESSAAMPPNTLEMAPPVACRGEPSSKPESPQWLRVGYDGERYCVKRTFVDSLPTARTVTISMPFTKVEDNGVRRYTDVYSIERDGRLLGKFTQSNLAVLSLLPSFTAGCGRFQMPVGWTCGLSFGQDIIHTDGIDAPPSRDNWLKLVVDQFRIATMLGLPPRSASELQLMAMQR